MPVPADEWKEKIRETLELLDSMVMVLKSRGCDNDHPLIGQTRQLGKFLKG